MAKTVGLNDKGLLTITRAFLVPIQSSREFFKDELAVSIDKDVQRMFKGQGSRKRISGEWKPYSPFTLHPSWKTKSGRKTNASKFNRRPGTDKSKSRRYSSSSKLLQASGSFRRSFKVIKIDDKTMTYGTNYELASDIISGGGKNRRQVLVVTDRDKAFYQKIWFNFNKKKVQF